MHCDGGVLVLVLHLRWAEVCCMTSFERVLCHGGCLNVSILQSTAVFTHSLLKASFSLASVHTWALYTGYGVNNSFAFFC